MNEDELMVSENHNVLNSEERGNMLGAIFADLDDVSEGREALLGTWESRGEEVAELREDLGSQIRDGFPMY